jgi:rhamnosyl/mannosyltransferase
MDESYNVIHLHTPNPTMLIAWSIAWLIGWVTGRPRTSLVITHHSDIIKQRFLKYALRPIEYWVYSQASCILTDSSEYIEGSKFLRAFKNNIKALPLGLDCSGYIQPSQAHFLTLAD